ncbi:Leucine-rich_repeat domain superfamily [Hexamita inflata]|uniref:Leucine-rich repeat domain superfamily n=1 Tax=Hexamita inflata TaxID=28002 RepID=A0AA86PDX0_9EUKA|nr:Leucine-rich repeat domain superfamily [Hexamita inflata]
MQISEIILDQVPPEKISIPENRISLIIQFRCEPAELTDVLIQIPEEKLHKLSFTVDQNLLVIAPIIKAIQCEQIHIENQTFTQQFHFNLLSDALKRKSAVSFLNTEMSCSQINQLCESRFLTELELDNSVILRSNINANLTSFKIKNTDLKCTKNCNELKHIQILQLTTLTLANCNIKNQQLEILSAMKCLNNIDLQTNYLTVKCFDFLPNKLVKLNLANNFISDKVYEYINNFTKLEFLDLSTNIINKSIIISGVECHVNDNPRQINNLYIHKYTQLKYDSDHFMHEVETYYENLDRILTIEPKLLRQQLIANVCEKMSVLQLNQLYTQDLTLFSQIIELDLSSELLVGNISTPLTNIRILTINNSQLDLLPRFKNLFQLTILDFDGRCKFLPESLRILLVPDFCGDLADLFGFSQIVIFESSKQFRCKIGDYKHFDQIPFEYVKQLNLLPINHEVVEQTEQKQASSYKNLLHQFQNKSKGLKTEYTANTSIPVNNMQQSLIQQQYNKGEVEIDKIICAERRIIPPLHNINQMNSKLINEIQEKLKSKTKVEKEYEYQQYPILNSNQSISSLQKVASNIDLALNSTDFKRHINELSKIEEETNQIQNQIQVKESEYTQPLLNLSQINPQNSYNLKLSEIPNTEFKQIPQQEIQSQQNQITEEVKNEIIFNELRQTIELQNDLKNELESDQIHAEGTKTDSTKINEIQNELIKTQFERAENVKMEFEVPLQQNIEREQIKSNYEPNIIENEAIMELNEQCQIKEYQKPNQEEIIFHLNDLNDDQECQSASKQLDSTKYVQQEKQDEKQLVNEEILKEQPQNQIKINFEQKQLSTSQNQFKSEIDKENNTNELNNDEGEQNNTEQHKSQIKYSIDRITSTQLNFINQNANLQNSEVQTDIQLSPIGKYKILETSPTIKIKGQKIHYEFAPVSQNTLHIFKETKVKIRHSKK